jgi:hypothetical protein
MPGLLGPALGGVLGPTVGDTPTAQHLAELDGGFALLGSDQ